MRHTHRSKSVVACSLSLVTVLTLVSCSSADSSETVSELAQTPPLTEQSTRNAVSAPPPCQYAA